MLSILDVPFRCISMKIRQINDLLTLRIHYMDLNGKYRLGFIILFKRKVYKKSTGPHSIYVAGPRTVGVIIGH